MTTEHWEVWRYRNAAGEEVARLSGQWTDENGKTHGFQANNVQIHIAEHMAKRLNAAADLLAVLVPLVVRSEHSLPFLGKLIADRPEPDDSGIAGQTDKHMARLKVAIKAAKDVLRRVDR